MEAWEEAFCDLMERMPGAWSASSFNQGYNAALAAERAKLAPVIEAAHVIERLMTTKPAPPWRDVALATNELLRTIQALRDAEEGK